MSPRSDEHVGKGDLQGNNDSEDGNGTDGEASLATTWKQWPDHQRAALGTQFFQHMTLENPLLVGSFFAGTSAPVHALRKLVGAHNFIDLVAADKEPDSQQFLQVNFRPKHLYGDLLVALRQKVADCLICDRPCDVVHTQQLDILTAGFPCKVNAMIFGSIQKLSSFYVWQDG